MIPKPARSAQGLLCARTGRLARGSAGSNRHPTGQAVRQAAADLAGEVDVLGGRRIKSVLGTDPGAWRLGDSGPMTTLRLTDGPRAAETIDTDILVVGAGPAGLATGITAARHGARVLVVERRPGTSTVPRATGVSTHTMELFRIWGMADAVRAAGVVAEPTMAVRRTLADEPLAVVPLGFPSLREALRASPELPALCPQDLIEPLLAELLRALGGQLRFGVRLTGLRHDATGAILATAGGHRIRARFVVGADGPHSTVRSLLGIGVEPLGTLGGHALVVFRPDVEAILGRRPHALNM